jgi:hypothetical protein
MKIIMTDYAKKMKEKLDVVTVSRDDFDALCKDRLDFGFDSIYFRYSEIVEELSWYKEIESKRQNEHFNRKAWCDSKRMHFYECLEQLVHAHQEVTENDN